MGRYWWKFAYCSLKYIWSNECWWILTMCRCIWHFLTFFFCRLKFFQKHCTFDSTNATLFSLLSELWRSFGQGCKLILSEADDERSNMKATLNKSRLHKFKERRRLLMPLFTEETRICSVITRSVVCHGHVGRREVILFWILQVLPMSESSFS